MYPAKTYELRVNFDRAREQSEQTQLKYDLIDWLHAHDVDSFVEGVIDDLDIDNEFGLEPRDFYGELGGVFAPLSIFKYSFEFVEDLRRRLEQRFGEKIACELLEQETSVWMEGWKESFKPVITDTFYIYPPWEAAPTDPTKIPIVIEPGMAFGTGQHATTILCLRVFEELVRNQEIDVKTARICDVGTGTGILAIAAAKLGATSLLATDIDEDAVSAARINAQDNAVSLPTRLESVPHDVSGGFDLIFANILAVVLKKLAPDLARACAPSGYVIMSGLLEEQMPELLEICAAEGLELVRKQLMNDWCALLLQKKGK